MDNERELQLLRKIEKMDAVVLVARQISTVCIMQGSANDRLHEALAKLDDIES